MSWIFAALVHGGLATTKVTKSVFEVSLEGEPKSDGNSPIAFKVKIKS